METHTPFKLSFIMRSAIALPILAGVALAEQAMNQWAPDVPDQQEADCVATTVTTTVHVITTVVTLPTEVIDIGNCEKCHKYGIAYSGKPGDSDFWGNGKGGAPGTSGPAQPAQPQQPAQPAQLQQPAQPAQPAQPQQPEQPAGQPGMPGQAGPTGSPANGGNSTCPGGPWCPPVVSGASSQKISAISISAIVALLGLAL